MLDEELGQDQEPSQDGNDSVDTDRATASGPRKHQNSIKRHELFWPDHACQAKYQVRLHDEAKDQIEIHFVHKVNLGGALILLHWLLGLKSKICDSRTLKFLNGVSGHGFN